MVRVDATEYALGPTKHIRKARIVLPLKPAVVAKTTVLGVWVHHIAISWCTNPREDNEYPNGRSETEGLTRQQMEKAPTKQSTKTAPSTEQTITPILPESLGYN